MFGTVFSAQPSNTATTIAAKDRHTPPVLQALRTCAVLSMRGAQQPRRSSRRVHRAALGYRRPDT